MSPRLPLPLCLGLLVTYGGMALNAGAQTPIDDIEPLPEPLTLEYALSLADEPHPTLQLTNAALDAARAGVLDADAANDLSIQLKGTLRYVQAPSYVADQSHDDSSAVISLDKTLYDFGRSAAARRAAGDSLSGVTQLQLDVRQQRRLEILQRYFEVVLADLQFSRYNEEMAVEYVALDRLRDRHEFGQVSDLDILEKEAAYQRARHVRFLSQNEQRAARARLALALNRPGRLPSQVIAPDLSSLDLPLPEDVRPLQQLALQHNPVVNALRAQLAAAEARVQAARATGNPRLNASIEAGSYARERTNYDDWRAELSLSIPLYEGRRTDAVVARERAEVFALQSRLSQAERDAEQQVLELWLQLDALRSKRDQRRAEARYRELYLDRSRALYELEVRADLGDAMVRFTEAERGARETEFEIALARIRLYAVMGQMNLQNPLQPPLQPVVLTNQGQAQ